MKCNVLTHTRAHTYTRTHHVYVVYKSVFAYKNFQCFRWRISNVINGVISDRAYALIRAKERKGESRLTS